MIIPFGDDQVRGGYFPFVTYAFILLNIVIFVYEASMSPDELQQFVFTYGAVPVEIMRGENLLTLLTSMFLHGGWAHLIGNMLFLWIFGDNIEATIGHLRYGLFYLLGGLAAHAGHIYFYGDSSVPTVGASGAISAIMGAYIVMFPHSRIRMLFFFFTFRIPAILFLGFWIYQQWISGSAALRIDTAQTEGVAWWAHIMGFAFGVIAGVYYRIQHRPRLDRRQQVWQDR